MLDQLLKNQMEELSNYSASVLHVKRTSLSLKNQEEACKAEYLKLEVEAPFKGTNLSQVPASYIIHVSYSLC